MKCDLNLAKVNVIKINETDPDVICLDVEVFASLLASEDVKLLANVSKKVKVENPKATKQKTKDRMIAQLKSCFECKNADVLFAIRGWIDSICTDPTKYLSKQQVLAFKSKLDDYCDGDAKKALAIIELATVHGYVDCQWAINLYERNNQPFKAAPAPTATMMTTRVTDSYRTTAVSDDVF